MLFGSSGIRGIVNEEVTAELALKVGKACASLYKKLVIGIDPRSSSKMIKNAVIAGSLSAGAEIADIGLVSTPTLAHSAKNYDAGIMITASHNPEQYNGIKLFNTDGSGFSIKQSEEIEKNLDGNNVKWNEVKRIKKYDNAVIDHIKSILEAISPIKNKIKVVVECSNGSTGTITPYLLRKMGCEVTTLNAQLDGFFPAHDPEPIEENLFGLKKQVIASNADIGLAHDCDGDRIVVINREGKFISNDGLLAILAKYTNEKGKIVVPINTSFSLDSYLPDAEIVRTKVGDIFISEKLKEIKGHFGGEPSGTYIFPSFSYCPDGIYAAAKIIKMLEDINVEEELKQIPQYHIVRNNVILTKKKIRDRMKKIEEELNKFDYEKVNKIDGIRIDMQDSWALIRPSGTEPKIRITVEAKEKVEVNNLYNKVMDIVKRCTK
ncbi:MAG: phosphoglucosamine mutase [Candidatus Thermoplasmatota archaeon]|nr:phosphoglucosamine mutase [Candidatus Thermoplasmatota archaeon]